MKSLISKFLVTLLFLALGLAGVRAQDGAAHDSEAAEGLDLHAVAELFKDSENLEAFEHGLNDPEKGINNLDLNENHEVDFIRVTEQVAEHTHLIVLQVPLGEDEFQDVATIAVEQGSGEQYNLQVQGDPVIYGPDYYFVPAGTGFGAWGVVRGLFRPNYHPYLSPFGFRTLPRWWGARQPVALNIYRARTGVFVGRRNFVASKTLTVRTLNKVNYHARTSTLVTRRTRVTRTTTTKTSTGAKTTTTTTKTKTHVTRKRP
jgi:hypothetical protein